MTETTTDTTTQNTDEENSDTSTLTSLKCRLLGHDWYYRPDEKECERCGELQPNDKERTDADPNAEIGDTQFSIEEDGDSYRIEVEEYQQTAWGPDSEYYQWFPVTSVKITESELEDLGGEVVTALGIEDQLEVE